MVKKLLQLFIDRFLLHIRPPHSVLTELLILISEYHGELFKKLLTEAAET